MARFASKCGLSRYGSDFTLGFGILRKPESRALGGGLFPMPYARFRGAALNSARYHSMDSKDTEHLNTPRLVADSAGMAVWRWDQQEPFGVNVADENPSGLGAFEFPVRDAGTYADKETSRVYNLNRYRDLDAGRFIQTDPLGLNGGDLSLYALRKNNPLSNVDPTGEAACAPGDTMCAIAMRNAGIRGPYFPSSKKLDEDCFLACLGIKVVGGQVISSGAQAGAGAAAGSSIRPISVLGRGVQAATRIVNTPLGIAVTGIAGADFCYSYCLKDPDQCAPSSPTPSIFGPSDYFYGAP